MHGSTAPVPAKGFRFETSDYIPKFSSSLHVEKPIAPFKFAPIDSFTPPMFNRIKQPTPAIKSDLAPEQVQVVGLELSAESSLYLIKKGSACFWCGVSGNVTQKISDENHLSSAPVRYHVQGLESSMEFLVIVGNDAPFNIDIITFSKVNKKWSYHKLSGDLGVNLPRNGIIMSIPAAMWVSVDNETSTDQQNSVVFPVLNILLNTGEIVSYSCVREGLDPSDVYFHPEMDKFASKKSNDIMQMCLTLIEKARLQDGEPNVFNQVISVVMYSDGMFSNGKFYYYNVLGNCLEKILEKYLLSDLDLCLNYLHLTGLQMVKKLSF